jgi:uncharacterized protein (DUF1697 family)
LPAPHALQRYAAFLRAINVGGHTVKMDRLRGLFEALGLAGVETFIASGNVVFDAPEEEPSALQRRIEEHLRASLGYEVATFLRSMDELAAAAAHRPFPASASEAEGAALTVAFLHEELDEEERRKIEGFRTGTDDFHVHGREVYWLRRPPASASAFSGAVLERGLGRPATLRNVTTVRKMAAKFATAHRPSGEPR